MSWHPDGPQGFESRKIKALLPRYTRGRGLEIGCGMEKAYPHFIGVDNGHHFGKGASDIVAHADQLAMFADESMDFVFSSHVLEHMADMGKALAEWSRVLKPGGFLCLYVPSANLYPKCGEPGANPDHKHDLYPGTIEGILRGGPHWWTQLECEERGDGIEYSLFEVYRKDAFVEGRLARVISPVRQVQTACVCRFGGFGDMLQAAVVFPQLKAEGFHLTVMTTPKGRDVLRHDPYVDDWYIVDPDQIPNQELVSFWAAQAERFDHFVNLSESIEGHLLALPGRMNHAWPQEVRHKRMNLNYHEWTAQLAGVEFKPAVLFWPNDEEMEAARRSCAEKEFNILWALSGSSCHKAYPHQDAVLARLLLEMPEARIFLVGDDACRVLEMGWEAEPRVVCLSGQLAIRDTLALAQQVDLVIGPETGVLNAVGMDANPHKVLMLSHSSPNNLSKHWRHTQALTPVDCPCYPCHRLHYSWEHCCEVAVPDDDGGLFQTGAARCAYNIHPASVVEAVTKVYANWQRGKL